MLLYKLLKICFRLKNRRLDFFCKKLSLGNILQIDLELGYHIIMRVLKKILKWIFVILVGSFTLFAIGIIIYLFYFFSQFDSSSYKDLAENYELKSKEIFELKTYVNSIVPLNKSVEIEFDNSNTFNIFHVVVDENRDENWNLDVNSVKANALFLKLNWTNETLRILKDKLEKANCISVSSGIPCKIGFHRSGMGMYFYNLFDKPITESLRIKYNNRCNYRIINDNVILEWAAGARGNQCFPDF